MTSVLLYHAAQSETVVVINRTHRSHELSLSKSWVLESMPPIISIAIVPERAFYHVECHSYYVSRSKLGAVGRACRVAVVSCLPVIDSPAVWSIRKRLFEVGDCRPCDPDLQQLSLVDEYFEIVLSSFHEDLCSEGGFEPVAF